MAVCVISITESGRNCLGVTLLLLNLSLAMIAFILVIVGITLSFIFNQQKDLLQNFNYRTKADLVMFSGIALMIFHLLGAKLCSDFGNIQTRQRSLKLAFPFLGLLFVAVMLLIFVSISASRVAATMQQGSEKAFLNLMESYHSDKDKKKQIDRIQITHKCCGSIGYK
ncbi:hypothetical protein AVEN_103209-1 [Araneus ventricosus]|uniref:Uncharacterized protein n=1 Tax=Araneus ventricosus TaxID=182803 RepID=A0A4Y2FA31_ARAVE|nr:hypothetical protein AVEN_103209-1 [Araneus ventricosus]